MLIQKLSKQELKRLSRSGSSGYHPYTDFIAGLRVGEGGRLAVAEEGVSRFSIKQRLTKSAAVAGVTIKFYRSPEDTVVFQVTERAQ